MRKYVGLLFALLAASPVYAQNGSFEAITVSTDAVGITRATYLGKAGCAVVIDGAAVRMRYDGTAPTTLVGTVIPDGGAWIFSATDAAFAQFIRDDGTDATANVSCWATASPASPIGAGGGGGSGGSVTQGTDPWIVAGDGVAGTPTTGVLSVQGIGSMTPLIVVGGGTAGVSGTNALTVQGIASGTAVTVAPSSGSFATDVVFGTATYTEATSTGPLGGAVRNDTPDALVNTTNEVGPLGTAANGGVWTALASDPCSYLAKSKAVGVITSATTTEIINASASNKVYICSIGIGPVSAANNVALVEDATNACASPDAGLYGGVTAANGWNIAANGGLTFANGLGSVTFTASTNVDVCLITSSTAVTPYVITYVLAP